MQYALRHAHLVARDQQGNDEGEAQKDARDQKREALEIGEGLQAAALGKVLGDGRFLHADARILGHFRQLFLRGGFLSRFLGGGLFGCGLGLFRRRLRGRRRGQFGGAQGDGVAQREAPNAHGDHDDA